MPYIYIQTMYSFSKAEKGINDRRIMDSKKNAGKMARERQKK